MEINALPLETVRVEDLREHPDNYQIHPPDQVRELKESIQKHDFYKNVVVANDNTILAGHGIVQAARELGMTEIPVRRKDVPPHSREALQLLIGDNEIQRRALKDYRKLATLLLQVEDERGDEGLRGTGMDSMMVSNLAQVTRPSDEIEDFNEDEHWVGMPAYDPEQPVLRVTIDFPSDEDKQRFLLSLGAERKHITAKNGRVSSMWWPLREREDPSSLRFEA